MRQSLALALAAVLPLAACEKKPAQPAQSTTTTAQTATASPGTPATPAPGTAAPGTPAPGVATPPPPAAMEELAASHILFMYKGSMPARPEVIRTKEEAQKIAEETLAKLKGGADFAALAKELSDCPSKSRGGDLGQFGRGMMAPPFEKAAFGLKPGEMSGVVET